MLETFVKERGIYYLIVALCAAGTLLKLVESGAYTKLLRAAENPDRTERLFIKQLKLKYKSCYRLGHRIHNTDAFVESSLFRYRVGFCSLESLGSLTNRVGLASIALAAVGVLTCMYYRMSSQAMVYHALAGLLAVIAMQLVDLQFASRTKRRMLIMVLKDYLENVLANQLEHTKKHRQLQNSPAADVQPDAEEAVETQIAAAHSSGTQTEPAREAVTQADRLKDMAHEKLLAEVIQEFFP